MHKAIELLILAILVPSIAGCAPEVGSDAWCDDMKEKAKGDWTINEASEYAKSCVLRF